MIPCKEYKCLKYPVCRNKTDIQCLSLFIYFTTERKRLGEKYNFLVRHEHAWMLIQTVFPNLSVLRGGGALGDEYKL